MSTHRLTGLIFTLVWIVIFSPLSAFAGPNKHSFQFSSNVAGAEVQAVGASEEESVIDKCMTPCALRLKSKKLSYFVFQHPEYPSVFMPLDMFKPHLETSADIRVEGKFEDSYAQIEAKKEAAFQAEHAAAFEAALNGPDAKAVPLLRIPPQFPLRADVSGWCHMSFSVSDTGFASDIVAKTCSDPIFESASKKGIIKWRFIPKVESNRFVSMENADTLISFKLLDERGDIIPAPIAAPEISP